MKDGSGQTGLVQVSAWVSGLELGMNAASVAQALETMRIGLQWKAIHARDVQEWLWAWQSKA